MNPLLRNSGAHVFVESLSAPRLEHADEHHLGRVLRLGDTDPITVSDGRGRWAPATWSRLRGVVLTGEVVEEPAQAPLVIGCAVPKGDRPDLIVQKLTELGIDVISFFEAARSVVHWDGDRWSKQHERLSRIAREAAMQSRRVVVPRVEFTTFEQLIGGDGIAIAEVGGRDQLDESVRGVLVGPEGGFDRDELDFMVPKVSLSRHVLRVETAAIVAAAVLVSRHR